MYLFYANLISNSKKSVRHGNWDDWFFSQDGPGRTRTDPDGPGRTRTDPDGPGRTRTDQASSGCAPCWVYQLSSNPQYDPQPLQGVLRGGYTSSPPTPNMTPSLFRVCSVLGIPALLL